MTDTYLSRPGSKGRRYAGLVAGFAITLVGGVAAIGVAILYGAWTDDPVGQLGVLGGAVFLAGSVGVTLVLIPGWRRFGAGLIAGSGALLVGDAALFLWIASHIE